MGRTFVGHRSNSSSGNTHIYREHSTLTIPVKGINKLSTKSKCIHVLLASFIVILYLCNFVDKEAAVMPSFAQADFTPTYITKFISKGNPRLARSTWNMVGDESPKVPNHHQGHNKVPRPSLPFPVWVNLHSSSERLTTKRWFGGNKDSQIHPLFKPFFIAFG